MSVRITAVLLVVCIASCITEDPKAQENQANKPTPAQNQAAQPGAQEKAAQPAAAAQPAQESQQATPAPEKSEFTGARDEFVGGVAAIGHSAARVGQAAIGKVAGIKDNLQNVGSQIVQTWSTAAQNTRDIVSNAGNTNNPAPAVQAPPPVPNQAAQQGVQETAAQPATAGQAAP